LVQKYPALFYAFIGSGQMVNPTEDDILGYQFALTYATEHGDTTTVDTLRRNGPPPYVGDNMFWKYWAYLPILDKDMAEHESAAVDSLFENALTAPEYGWMDKINLFRGPMDVWSAFYPKLVHVDLTTQAARLDVPVYFLEGRFDVNAMTSLVGRYYSVLQAPHKELIWFAKAGHPSFIYDPNKVVDVLVNRVLAQTWPGQ
jgi:pimeloyl-ACP methyl ester carboxylesterase